MKARKKEMFRVSIKQDLTGIICEFNDLCDALKYIETTMEVCEGAAVSIEEVDYALGV